MSVKHQTRGISVGHTWDFSRATSPSTSKLWKPSRRYRHMKPVFNDSNSTGMLRPWQGWWRQQERSKSCHLQRGKQTDVPKPPIFLLSNSFLMITGKFSVMMGALLYVLGLCECHSKLTDKMHIPLRPIPKGGIVRHWRFYKLGSWQELANLITWYVECNSVKFTLSRKC